ncbi:hypothetical protein SARC_03949 [Sphaeroforma arctica JP610]|uniref:PPIase cyclophilin-type domain-containing protein n=1 Tax=Sphaeroforma arctica JP610 TaxID=667725 RepID=A0A0L0G438_9EUKA|nr:hypothetical protein SARC_03949 [Sphaeroforma arctica JP610]KNC83820.1 hypothetical protein SARC_03949 [Sphaeroforma arctica JP610]|eukprot:XP_014157722.1 hypothetical protein SARC_03949 [Sphaeroforma arctica JP610]
MSNIYVMEPPTNGKVVMHTNYGEIGIELWGKETPKAVRNFIQLCMEGYYDDNIVNRISKGFMIQMGDPTGTGFGGESIYDEPFKDEFHQRLKFSRRGLVAMANSGSHDNRSQFFITLDKTEGLNKKHTLFGRVDHETIFNVLRVGDAETDEDERPLNPPRIKYIEVLVNPFDDIVPRSLPARLAKIDQARANKESKAKGSKMKKTRDAKLLSFGGDDDEEDEGEADNMFSSKSKTKRMKIKSAHEALADPTLAAEVGAIEPVVSEEKSKGTSANGDGKGASVSDDKVRETEDESDTKKYKEDTSSAAKTSKSLTTAEQTEKLVREIRESKRRQRDMGDGRIAETNTQTGVNDNQVKSAVDDGEAYLEAQRRKYADSLGSTGKAKADAKAKALLESFQMKVSARSWADKSDEEEEEEESNGKNTDSASLDADMKGKGGGRSTNGDDWMSHALDFDPEDSLVLSKDPFKDNAEDMYTLEDPRNPLTIARRERDAKDKFSTKDKRNRRDDRGDNRHGNPDRNRREHIGGDNESSRSRGGYKEGRDNKGNGDDWRSDATRDREGRKDGGRETSRDRGRKRSRDRHDSRSHSRR